MSRVALKDVHALKFYKDASTLSRRGDPIPQLICVGKPCRLYQPDIVRCTSLGGSGTDVDWKCEADLPDSLRFGRVEVSCEGWDRPGDPYILKGSCGLEYKLVQVPDALRRGGDSPVFPSRHSGLFFDDVAADVFVLVWMIIAATIVFLGLKSCWEARTRSNHNATSPRPPRDPGTGPGRWFSGGNPPRHPHDSPPPYTKYPSTSTHATGPTPGAGGWQGWRPGFWTGAAVGGLGAHLLNQRNRERAEERPTFRQYDWEERERPIWAASRRQTSSSWLGGSAGRRRTGLDDSDRGEGPSDLGRMRSSTGLGGSRVR